jgi:hypothetical protein
MQKKATLWDLTLMVTVIRLVCFRLGWEWHFVRGDEGKGQGVQSFRKFAILHRSVSSKEHHEQFFRRLRKFGHLARVSQHSKAHCHLGAVRDTFWSFERPQIHCCRRLVRVTVRKQGRTLARADHPIPSSDPIASAQKQTFRTSSHPPPSSLNPDSCSRQHQGECNSPTMTLDRCW